MQEIMDRLKEANTQLFLAKKYVMEQKPSFFLVMIGTYIGVVISIISVALDLLWKEIEKEQQI